MTNIVSYKGLPLSLFIELDNEDNTAYDPTLYTYRGQVRSYADASLVGEFTVTSGVNTQGEPGINIELSAVDSAAIPNGIYGYDILQNEIATSIEIPAVSGDFIQTSTRTAP